MSHGNRDWSSYGLKSTVYNLQDMAELAARLGSIHTYDRRGDVVWADDFESTVNKWTLLGLGIGEAIALSDEAVRNGAKSLKMTTPALAGVTMGAQRLLSVLHASSVGVEFHACPPLNLSKLHLAVNHYDGSTLVTFAVRIDQVNSVIEYQDSSAAWVTLVSPFNFTFNAGLFHAFKIVGDLVSKKYKRLLCNNHEIDMSAITAFSGASAIGPLLQTSFYATAKLALAVSVYIDDFIVTQNEP